MKKTTATRALTGALAVAGLSTAAATLGMAPAHASPSDTDRPRATSKSVDFGENWAAGAPINGGHLYWTQNNNGDNSAKLEGNLYLTDGACGRVHIEYYDGDHQLLKTKNTDVECGAKDGSKTQFYQTRNWSAPGVVHVHVSVQKQKSDGSFVTKGTDYEDFD